MHAQVGYDQCSNAFELCPNKIASLNNIGATATVCPNCEDDFNFCFSGENTIWMTFTTNDDGGDVTANFTGLNFENLPGQGSELQATIIEATVPCVSSSYSTVANCVTNATTNFSLTANTLPPNTTYYIVVNGSMGSTENAEATVDITLSGNGIIRNPQFSIGTNTNTVCTGNTVIFNAYTTSCPDQSVFDWYINGVYERSTLDSSLVVPDLSNGDVVSAKVHCYTQCTDTLTSNSISMSVLDFPVDAGIDTTIQQGENIQLEGSTTESDIMWSPSYAMNNATILNPIVDPDETTTYFLTVDNGTCSITDEMTVFVENNLTVPNTFSPNGDGINDDWEILGINQFPDCTIQVYTRWGQLVFQSTGYSLSKRWDGTSKNGKPLVAGAYYYVINLRSDEFDKPLKGTVSIVK